MWTPRDEGSLPHVIAGHHSCAIPATSRYRWVGTQASEARHEAYVNRDLVEELTMMPVSASRRRNCVMDEINNLALYPGRPERKHRRFLASYPVELRVHSEGKAFDLQAITQNVSIGGLLLVNATPVPKHSPVDFVMTLHGGQLIRLIRVVGQGEVLRVDPLGPGAGFVVAIKCKREIECNLTAFAG